MIKKWQVRRGISEETKAEFQGVNPLVLQLFFNRGLTKKQQMEEFLRASWSYDVYDPWLLSGMKSAVERIFLALEKQEKITLFGDYDADGVCGTAILFKTLKRIGVKDLDYYIPHRENEGYGLNVEAIERIAGDGTKLLITIDLGVSNIEQVELSNKLGMDVIVVDHHEMKEEDGKIVLPKAHAIIHARIPSDEYPYKYLSGTGTAFKLAQAMLDNSMEENEAFEKWLLDLTAIGTVADVVPLTGENRTLVKYGLTVLNKTQNLGLRELIKRARLKNGNVKSVNGYSNDAGITSGPNQNFGLTSWNIAFQLAPRINAAGRLSHAKEALDLLLTEGQTEAVALADHLHKINQERQGITEKIYKEAMEQIGETTDKYILIAYNPDWPLGVVGLVAGKIMNEYYKPVILLTDKQGLSGEELIVGSGRSIPEYNIIDGLKKTGEILEQYGGHPAACGITLKKINFNNFKVSIEKVVARDLKDIDLTPSINIDVEVDVNDISTELVEELEKFEPYGHDNPQPLFLSKKLVVKQIDFVGAKKQHLKLLVTGEQSQKTLKLIGFNLANGWQNELQVGDKIDIVYELGFNEWNGNRELQMKLVDLRKSYA